MPITVIHQKKGRARATPAKIDLRKRQITITPATKSTRTRINVRTAANQNIRAAHINSKNSLFSPVVVTPQKSSHPEKLNISLRKNKPSIIVTPPHSKPAATRDLRASLSITKSKHISTDSIRPRRNPVTSLDQNETRDDAADDVCTGALVDRDLRASIRKPETSKSETKLAVDNSARPIRDLRASLDCLERQDHKADDVCEDDYDAGGRLYLTYFHTATLLSKRVIYVNVCVCMHV